MNRDAALLLQQMEAVYNDFPARIHRDSWKDLRYPLITDEIREAVIGFLCTHPYLPDTVIQWWEDIFAFHDLLFKEDFSWSELPDGYGDVLSEWILPALTSQPHEQFEYELFDVRRFGQPDAPDVYDYEAFIPLFRELQDELACGFSGLAESQQLLAKLKQTGVFHPYLVLAEIQVLLLQHEQDSIAVRVPVAYPADQTPSFMEEAWQAEDPYVERIPALLARIWPSYRSSPHVACAQADYQLHCGNLMEAKQVYHHILLQYPDHYGARAGMARCLLLEKKYNKAAVHIHNLGLANEQDRRFRRLAWDMEQELKTWQESAKANGTYRHDTGRVQLAANALDRARLAYQLDCLGTANFSIWLAQCWDEDNPQCYYLDALNLRRMSRKEESRQAYHIYMEKRWTGSGCDSSEDMPSAFLENMEEWISTDSEGLDFAETELREFEQMTGIHGTRILLLRGKIHEARGNPGKAITFYLQILRCGRNQVREELLDWYLTDYSEVCLRLLRIYEKWYLDTGNLIYREQFTQWAEITAKFYPQVIHQLLQELPKSRGIPNLQVVTLRRCLQKLVPFCF